MSSLTLSLQQVLSWSQINQHQQFNADCSCRSSERQTENPLAHSCPLLLVCNYALSLLATVPPCDQTGVHVAYSAPSVVEWDASAVSW